MRVFSSIRSWISRFFWSARALASARRLSWSAFFIAAFFIAAAISRFSSSSASRSAFSCASRSRRIFSCRSSFFFFNFNSSARFASSASFWAFILASISICCFLAFASILSAISFFFFSALSLAAANFFCSAAFFSAALFNCAAYCCFSSSSAACLSRSSAWRRFSSFSRFFFSNSSFSFNSLSAWSFAALSFAICASFAAWSFFWCSNSSSCLRFSALAAIAAIRCFCSSFLEAAAFKAAISLLGMFDVAYR